MGIHLEVMLQKNIAGWDTFRGHASKTYSRMGIHLEDMLLRLIAGWAYI